VDILRDAFGFIKEIARSLTTIAQPRTAPPAAVDVNRTAERAASVMRPCAASRGVSITVDLGTPLPVFVGPADPFQVFLNLLNNALEANESDRGGWIGISASFDGRTAEARVADAGPGIPPGDLVRVLSPYHTA
jgi:signal transduction histidine kinase